MVKKAEGCLFMVVFNYGYCDYIFVGLIIWLIMAFYCEDCLILVNQGCALVCKFAMFLWGN